MQIDFVINYQGFASLFALEAVSLSIIWGVAYAIKIARTY